MPGTHTTGCWGQMGMLAGTACASWQQCPEPRLYSSPRTAANATLLLQDAPQETEAAAEPFTMVDLEEFLEAETMNALVERDIVEGGWLPGIRLQQ